MKHKKNNYKKIDITKVNKKITNPWNLNNINIKQIPKNKESVSIGTQTYTENINDNFDDECCICMEKSWICRTDCMHYICVTCLVQINKECPICRKDLSDNLPNILKPIAKMNKRKVNKNINIYDNSDFPELF